MRSSVEYARRFHEREREKSKGKRERAQCKICQRVYYTVSKQRASLHNGLVNGTMSRSSRAIIADDFAL